MDAIAKECGGWLRSSSMANGESAEVWIGDDKTYVFSGEGLIKFLYAVKGKQTEQLDAAVELCQYIAGSAKTLPSVFVRDAIVGRAAALLAKIKGEA